MLMGEVAGGNPAAFRKLFQRYQVPIYSYLFSITRDGQMAEDLTQETFLRVFRNRANYTREARFTTWLWTIARNAAIDHIRKKKETPLGEEIEEATMGDSRGLEPNDAETLLVQKADQQAIADCLGRLPDSQRDALAMRIFSELDYAEIAKTMESTVPAIKSVLHRGKQSLVDCLKRKSYG